MNAKEQAREIWDKVSAWGTARIEALEPLELVSLAINPPRKAKILDEERAYAESIIAAALAEHSPPIDASVERVAQDIQDLFLVFGNETPIEDVEKLIAARDAEIIAGTKQAHAAALAEKDKRYEKALWDWKADTERIESQLKAIHSAAIAEKEAEIALKLQALTPGGSEFQTIDECLAYITEQQKRHVAHIRELKESRDYWRSEAGSAALLPPDEPKEVKPMCATCAWNTQDGEPEECECEKPCSDWCQWAERIDDGQPID